MQSTIPMSQIKKEIARFLVVGFSAFGTDLLVYYFLLHFFSHSLAKASSFITASILAYLLNKYWTFTQARRSFLEIVRFVILYISTLGANVAVNRIHLVLFPDWVFLAFLSASATSTVLNFIGQKWWVFKKVRMEYG